MRILLATEGESDQIVAERLLLKVLPNSQIQPKRMPARGIAVVKRLLRDIVRAAHFGHFELLVIHFDLDDTWPQPCEHVQESERWLEIRKQVDNLVVQLGNLSGRTSPLHAIFMAPAQSTDAWLRWALMNGDGRKWERKDRHTLKRELFGNPPRKLLEKASVYADQLLAQMQKCDQWPRSLSDFHAALEAFATEERDRNLLT
jgi:hypothetical protein